MTSGTSAAAAKAGLLRRLHTDPEVLVLVNVWDVAGARVVARLPGCRALATASHSIAAALGYPDGEQIPPLEMVAAVERIARAVDLPVSADIEAGYGDVATTVRRVIAAGAAGGNLEDAMRPLPEAVAAVEAALAAAAAEGVPFVLNARTDAYLERGGRGDEEVLADAVARGRAYLAAGADCVFVPGVLDAPTIAALAAGIGDRRISVLAGPGGLPARELGRLGVARVSYGPWTQRVALTALAETGAELLADGVLPPGVRSFG